MSGPRLILILVSLGSLALVAGGCTKASLINAQRHISGGTNPPAPPPLPPTAGFGVVTGGAIQYGTGMQVHGTVGEVTSPSIQTGPSEMNVTGVQGTLLEP